MEEQFVTWGADTVVAVVALILLGIAGVIAYALYRKQILERRVLIDEASNLFARHFEAVNKLVDDPATPELVKAFALDFSLGINDPRVSQGFSRRILSKSPPASRPDRQHQLDQVLDQIEALRRHREDLARAFYDATFTGMTAVVLRESARNKDVFEALHLAAKVPVQRQREATKDIIERALSPIGMPNGCGPLPA